jgi:hypothetical protein
VSAARRLRVPEPEVYRVLRVVAPPPPRVAEVREHALPEIGVGWTRTLVREGADLVMEYRHHGAMAYRLHLFAAWLPVLLAAIGDVRAGRPVAAKLYHGDLPGCRSLRVRSELRDGEPGLALRVQAVQRIRVGPRPVPVAGVELEALERALTTITRTP